MENYQRKKTAIVLGAGPAGLACAAMLKSRGVSVTILEKEATLCPVWRNHYDRLHLHTDKSHSSLPGYPMPADFPKYPSRLQVIRYLDAYAAHHGLEPIFGCEVEKVAKDGNWIINTTNGAKTADIVVVAMGTASYPFRPSWPGLDGFPGTVLHSNAYKNPEKFKGQQVLVVGFGNSGGEIALDLANVGILPRLSVRGPVNIVPRDILGIPILTLTILQQSLPYRLVDHINKPVLRLCLGDTKSLGLQPASKGPMAQVIEDGKIPLLDVGTLKALRDGTIELRPGIDQIDGQDVSFVDGQIEAFDTIVLGTGYRPDLRNILPELAHLLDDEGVPKKSGANSGEDGLYFCSYRASPTGQIRQMGIEATGIAKAAAP